MNWRWTWKQRSQWVNNLKLRLEFPRRSLRILLFGIQQDFLVPTRVMEIMEIELKDWSQCRKPQLIHGFLKCSVRPIQRCSIERKRWNALPLFLNFLNSRISLAIISNPVGTIPFRNRKVFSSSIHEGSSSNNNNNNTSKNNNTSLWTKVSWPIYLRWNGHFLRNI